MSAIACDMAELDNTWRNLISLVPQEKLELLPFCFAEVKIRTDTSWRGRGGDANMT